MKNSNALLEINTKSLIYNYKALRIISNKSILAATIKANAYGIGDIKVFDILYKNKCRHFFVATVEEALLIRKKRSYGKIYILSNNNLDPGLDDTTLVCINIDTSKLGELCEEKSSFLDIFDDRDGISPISSL